jgi:hypothetical protein
LASPVHQPERFSAAENLPADGFTLVFRHVRVDRLAGRGVRGFPHSAAENRAVHVALVNFRACAAVRAGEPQNNFNERHFFESKNTFIFFSH